MKFNEIFSHVKLTEADKQTNGKWHNPPEGDDNTPVTTVNAKDMTKKDMEEYDLFLVIDKKTFGFNIGGTFLVMGMKFKPDGGLEVRVPKTQRADGKIYIPSNRSGTKFVLSKGPDTGPSIPVDTHVASSLFNRGINEGKELFEGYTPKERLMASLLKKYNAACDKEHSAYMRRGTGGKRDWHVTQTALSKEIEAVKKEFVKNFGYLKDEEGNKVTVKNFSAYDTEDIPEFIAAYKDQIKE